MKYIEGREDLTANDVSNIFFDILENCPSYCPKF